MGDEWVLAVDRVVGALLALVILALVVGHHVYQNWGLFAVVSRHHIDTAGLVLRRSFWVVGKTAVEDVSLDPVARRVDLESQCRHFLLFSNLFAFILLRLLMLRRRWLVLGLLWYEGLFVWGRLSLWRLKFLLLVLFDVIVAFFLSDFYQFPVKFLHLGS